MEKREKEMISIIIPCYNEEEVLPLFYDEIVKLSKKMNYVSFEYIFINDGSKDKTLDIIKQYSKKDKKVRYVSFSRNFGKEAAMLAGLQTCRGDYAVIIDADLQHPPYLIEKMYDMIKNDNCDCVGTLQKEKEERNTIRKILTKIYYKLINEISGIKIIKGERDFRLINRKVINSIISLRERNRYMIGLYNYVGFRREWIEYESVDRAAGETKWSLGKLFSYALSGIISLTTAPLLFSAVIGVVLILISIILLIVSLIRLNVGHLLFINLFILFTGIQMFCIGIIGQYLSKIYKEKQKRPNYIIGETEKDLK